MLKRIAILTVLCLAVSLWPARVAGVRLGDDGRRHVGGLAGHSAILGASARVRVQVRAPHCSSVRILPPEAAPVCVRPVLFSARSVHTLPTYRVATHLSL